MASPSPSWKPWVDKSDVMDMLDDTETEIFCHHMNLMRHEPDPLAYRPTLTSRQAVPGSMHHAIRLRGIEGEFIFTMSDRSSLSADDIAQSPGLKGTLKFVKFLRDGD